MATTQTLFQFPQFFTDNTGNPLNGGSVYFYQANSSTPQNTYSDRGLTVVNPNPIMLNSSGFPIVSNTEVTIYPIDAAYKVIVKDAAGTTLHTWDFLDPNAPFNILSVANLTDITLTDPIIDGSVTSTLFNSICQGRLTLVSGTPVTTGNDAGSTIYFTPYLGNNIALYGVNGWALQSFTEQALILSGLTSSVCYDVFIDSNVGLSNVAWSTASARATALAVQDGVLVSSADSSLRYLGTFYATSASSTEDYVTARYLYNYYNRVPKIVKAAPTTDSWTYTTATFRQANADTNNQLNVVQGWAEDAISMTLNALCLNSGGGVSVNIGIGANSTTVNSGYGGQGTAATTRGGVSCSFVTTPPVGLNYYAWLESSSASGTTTWYGDNGGTIFQAGMTGIWRC